MKKADREKQILEFIEDYHAKHQWAPSVREICDATGIKSTSTVQDILLDLAKEKKIIYNGVRQIRVLVKPEGIKTAAKPVVPVAKKARKEERPNGSLLARLL